MPYNQIMSDVEIMKRGVYMQINKKKKIAKEIEINADRYREKYRQIKREIYIYIYTIYIDREILIEIKEIHIDIEINRDR